MGEQKNLLTAFILSAVVIFGFQYFYGSPKTALPPIENVAAENTAPQSSATPTAQTSNPVVKQVTRTEALHSSQRITINTPKLGGSLNLTGGRIDDVVLKHYNETTDKNSAHVKLFSPEPTENPHYAEFGWITNQKNIDVPNSTTVWQSSSKELTVDTPAILRWSNAQGVTFERKISVDKDYLFTVNDRIVNESGQHLHIFPYALIARGGDLPDGTFVMHEGPIGVVDTKLKTLDYSDLKKDQKVEYPSCYAWLGFTDKYWLSAIIPSKAHKVKGRFIHDGKKFQSDFVGEEKHCEGNSCIESTFHLFAGAKIVELLDQYEGQLGAAKFDLAVDFGWFYFITKPTFYVLTAINDFVKNFGISILILTILFKLALFPLANKSFRSMNRMKALQPEMKKLQERYADDKVKMNQELMGLYKKEGVNPLSGCLPMIIQAPILFALYKVLYISIEMRHAPFIGWIKDLSAPDPTSIFNLFGLIPFDPPSFLMLGILPLILGLSMFVQQKMSPAPADPAQAKVMLMMPIMFTFMLAQFPAGLVIYWIWSNLLSILQQWYMAKAHA